MKDQKHELRVFYNYFELDRDYHNFIESSMCHQHHPREQTARSGDWLIRWTIHDRANNAMSLVAGMHFERIQVDMRTDWQTKRYLLTRLRSRQHKVEAMMTFYEHPYETLEYK